MILEVILKARYMRHDLLSTLATSRDVWHIGRLVQVPLLRPDGNVECGWGGGVVPPTGERMGHTAESVGTDVSDTISIASGAVVQSTKHCLFSIIKKSYFFTFKCFYSQGTSYH